MAQRRIDRTGNESLDRTLAKVNENFTELFEGAAGDAAVLEGITDLIASPATYSETPADIAAVLVAAGLMQPND